jgi:hypothetical protein
LRSSGQQAKQWISEPLKLEDLDRPDAELLELLKLASGGVSTTIGDAAGA